MSYSLLTANYIASQPKVPQELCEDIISFQVSRRTLRTCALVCRAWLPKSRHLSMANHYRPMFHEDEAYKLIAILESPFSTFSTYLTRLALSMTPEVSNSVPPLHCKSRVGQIIKALVATPNSSQITDLSLHIDLRKSHENWRLYHLPGLVDVARLIGKQLTRLEMSGRFDEYLVEVVSFISECWNLRTLIINGGNRHYNYPKPGNTPPPNLASYSAPPFLNSMRLAFNDKKHAEAFLKWMKGTRMAEQTLHALEVQIRQPLGLRRVSELLVHPRCEQLRRLKLTFAPWEYISRAALAYINLYPSLRHLEELTIMHIGLGTAFALDSMQGLVNVLQKFTSLPALRRLDLVIGGRGLLPFFLDFHVLDRLLTEELSHLKYIQVSITHQDDDDSFTTRSLSEEEWKQTFPLSADRPNVIYKC